MNLNFIKDTIEDKWDDSMSLGTLFLIILAIVMFIIVFSLIGWWIEWLLWGAIMVKVFSLLTLTFWQMAGLDILFSMLIPHSTVSSKSKD